MTLVSRVTGLIRDIAFAQVLGSGAIADAFFVAFRIPNFLRRIFGEGAFSVAFVPVYSEYESRYPPQQAHAFLNLMAGRLGLILVTLTVAGVLGAPALVSMLAPGFSADPAKYEATVSALRLTFPYLFFISLVAMAGGILNTRERFAAHAATPILLNLCLIATVWLVVPRTTNIAITLGGGVLIAGIVQLAFQFPFLWQVRRVPRPRLRATTQDERVGSEGVSQVFRLMLPAVFGVSIAQINLLVNTILASFLVTGSVSWLYYSDRLMEFPLGVFGIALATVILPTLSRQVASSEQTAYSQTLDWALRLVFLVALPATAALAILAFPLMVTLFHYGQFSATDASMASKSLIAFALGLTGFILVKVLAPGFYARKDTRTPAIIGAIAMGVNALVAVSLVFVFTLGHVGLALATSLAGIVNAVLLYIRLVSKTGFQPGDGWPAFLARVSLATLIMAALLAFGVAGDLAWLSHSVPKRILLLGFWVIAGGGVYLGSLYLLGLKVHRFVERP
jgi:putative peptidoglycan lipid II flippase